MNAELQPNQDGTYQRPPKQCDLIMKGGVTSGVVYPPAILELAKDYRFRSVGGTSAGAIAAAAAAAAEYGREKVSDSSPPGKRAGSLMRSSTPSRATRPPAIYSAAASTSS